MRAEHEERHEEREKGCRVQIHWDGALSTRAAQERGPYGAQVSDRGKPASAVLLLAPSVRASYRSQQTTNHLLVIGQAARPLSGYAAPAASGWAAG